MILCGTGHRPNKLGGYANAVTQRLINIAQQQLLILRPEIVISGMALGWDQALAEAAWKMKIPFHAYIPFEGQEKMWPKQSKDDFNLLRQSAERVVICCEGGYASWKMQRRNEMMVDAADQVLALFDGSISGTWNCIKYAEQKSKPIINCWSKFKEMK